MTRKSETYKGARKAWVAPELRRLSAGSAEARSGTLGDGGGPGANRS